MNEKLAIPTIIQEGIKLGLKNFPSLVGSVLLYFLTFWIPYLNVGTTIAISTLPIKMSEGKIISPTEIFASKYRKNMGEFLLLMGLLTLIIMMGYMFMIIPGIVMAIAYGYSLYFLVDKEVSPTEALNMSNKATYGYKWNIFLSRALFIIGLQIVIFIFSLLGVFGAFLIFVVLILVMPIFLGMDAYIYKSISNNDNSTMSDNSDLIDNILIEE